MSNYRRILIPGATHFFTVVTKNRRPWFDREERVEILREAFRKVMSKRPFHMDAVVLLPDHIHCIWKLPVEGVSVHIPFRPAVAFFRVSGASLDAQDQGTLRLIRTETLKKATAGRGHGRLQQEGCERLRGGRSKRGSPAISTLAQTGVRNADYGRGDSGSTSFGTRKTGEGT